MWIKPPAVPAWPSTPPVAPLQATRTDDLAHASASCGPQLPTTPAASTAHSASATCTYPTSKPTTSHVNNGSYRSPAPLSTCFLPASNLTCAKPEPRNLVYSPSPAPLYSDYAPQNQLQHRQSTPRNINYRRTCNKILTPYTKALSNDHGQATPAQLLSAHTSPVSLHYCQSQETLMPLTRTGASDDLIDVDSGHGPTYTSLSASTVLRIEHTYGLRRIRPGKTGPGALVIEQTPGSSTKSSRSAT